MNGLRRYDAELQIYIETLKERLRLAEDVVQAAFDSVPRTCPRAWWPDLNYNPTAKQKWRLYEALERYRKGMNTES